MFEDEIDENIKDNNREIMELELMLKRPAHPSILFLHDG